MKKVFVKTGLVVSLAIVSLSAVSCDLFGKKDNAIGEPTTQGIDSANVEKVDSLVDSAQVEPVAVDAPVEGTVENAPEKVVDNTAKTTEEKAK